MLWADRGEGLGHCIVGWPEVLRAGQRNSRSPRRTDVLLGMTKRGIGEGDGRCCGLTATEKAYFAFVGLSSELRKRRPIKKDTGIDARIQPMTKIT